MYKVDVWGPDRREGYGWMGGLGLVGWVGVGMSEWVG